MGGDDDAVDVTDDSPTGDGGENMEVGLLAAIAIECIRLGKHVNEIFSPLAWDP